MGEPCPARVHAILVTFHRHEDLRESVGGLVRQSVKATTLVVVDNGGDVGAGQLRAMADGRDGLPIIRLIASDNSGPAGGYNLGLEALDEIASDDDWVLMLDDDDPMRDPEILELLLNRAESLLARYPRTVGVGLKGATFDSRRLRTMPVHREGGSLMSEPAVPIDVPVDHLHGGYFPLYRRKALRRCGGFRSELFWGFEELDLGLRLGKQGGLLWVAPDLLAQVPANPKTSNVRTRPSPWVEAPTPRRYYTLRNLTDIGLRNAPRRYVYKALLIRALIKPLVSLPVHPVWAVRALRLNRRAVWDARRGTLGRRLDLEMAAHE